MRRSSIFYILFFGLLVTLAQANGERRSLRLAEKNATPRHVRLLKRDQQRAQAVPLQRETACLTEMNESSVEEKAQRSVDLSSVRRALERYGRRGFDNLGTQGVVPALCRAKIDELRACSTQEREGQYGQELVATLIDFSQAPGCLDEVLKAFWDVLGIPVWRNSKAANFFYEFLIDNLNALFIMERAGICVESGFFHECLSELVDAFVAAVFACETRTVPYSHAPEAWKILFSFGQGSEEQWPTLYHRLLVLACHVEQLAQRNEILKWRLRRQLANVFFLRLFFAARTMPLNPAQSDINALRFLYESVVCSSKEFELDYANYAQLSCLVRSIFTDLTKFTDNAGLQLMAFDIAGRLCARYPYSGRFQEMLIGYIDQMLRSGGLHRRPSALKEAVLTQLLAVGCNPQSCYIAAAHHEERGRLVRRVEYGGACFNVYLHPTFFPLARTCINVCIGDSCTSVRRIAQQLHDRLDVLLQQRDGLEAWARGR